MFTNSDLLIEKILVVIDENMKNELKTGDFDFEYTGSNHIEKDAIENGFRQLTGEELRKRIIN